MVAEDGCPYAFFSLTEACIHAARAAAAALPSLVPS